MATLDLYPRAPSLVTPSESVVSVGDVVREVSDNVAHLFKYVWISGEVGNCSTSSAGHTYFALKDDVGQINCVLFKGEADRHAGPAISMGQKLEVRGVLGVYQRSGALQIRLSDWRQAGVGALYEAYLARKTQLAREGLFDPDLKKALPRFVKSVGLVTSRQGAVAHDVRRTLDRRMPWTQNHRRLYPTAVQGEGAPLQIIDALKRADAAGHDVILLVRGGGSFEDLFCFNDDALVRALRELKTPVVTGIGHESDETLAGLASDLNASTPTAAAEMLGPSIDEWWGHLAYCEDVLFTRTRNYLDYATERVDRAEGLLSEPPVLLRGTQAVERAQAQLTRLIQGILGRAQDRFASAQTHFPMALGRHQALLEARLLRCAQQLAKPDAVLGNFETRLTNLNERLTSSMDGLLQTHGRVLTQEARHFEVVAKHKLSAATQRLDAQARALSALSPERPLQLGYAMVERAGHVEEGMARVELNDELTLKMRDGSLTVTVTDRTPHEKNNTTP